MIHWTWLYTTIVTASTKTPPKMEQGTEGALVSLQPSLLMKGLNAREEKAPRKTSAERADYPL